jgi:hypothetical protein
MKQLVAPLQNLYSTLERHRSRGTLLAIFVGLIGALLMSACGGGGGQGPPPGIDSAAVALNAPAATSQPKQIALSWAAGGAGAAAIAEYRVQLRADNAAAYTQLGAGVAAAATSSDMALPDLTAIDWAQASVRVQACDAAGACVASNEQLLVSVLASAVGYFKASNTGSADFFGQSVALSADGNTLAVGAVHEDSGADGVNGVQADESALDSGAVYVFARGAGGWSQQAYLKSYFASVFARFGMALALSSDGSTLAVGATGGGGAVSVFVRSGASWSRQEYLVPPENDDGDGFGSAVALSGNGNTLAVGARGEASAATGSEGDETDDSKPNSGAVYVYSRAANGNWSKQEYLKASNSGVGDRFGSRVALSDSGTTLAVSAPLEGSNATGVGGNQLDNSATRAGAVYVFARFIGFSGVDWTQQAYLKASNTTSFSDFGDALAISADGNTLVVGAPVEDSSAKGINNNGVLIQAKDSGAAYVFVRSGATWTQEAYIKASNTNSGDRFAGALALSADGNTLAVGAPRESSAATTVNGSQSNSAGAAESGAVYLFARSSGTWAQRSYVKAPNNDAGDWFGSAVALSSDGSSLAVAAILEGGASTGLSGDRSSNGLLQSGAVYLY